ncbi:hypothetical protein TNCV_3473161 [Trichonephila clavipes]|nr:hypothetical protein TNCV_3473161 [Trichonephila clavipes]
MLIQPANSRPGLVRGTVVLLENSITVWITEQHKRMESSNLVCRIHGFMNLTPSSQPPIGLKESESTPCYSFPVFYTPVSLAQARRVAQWRALSNSTLDLSSLRAGEIGESLVIWVEEKQPLEDAGKNGRTMAGFSVMMVEVDLRPQQIRRTD